MSKPPLNPAETGTASLRARSMASFKWSALGELLSRSLQPLLVLVVGSFISPAEFGLLGIATIALGVAQLLQDMGLGKTLIQTQGNVAEQANTVFWINLAFSGLLYGLILAAAPLIARFFDAPASSTVLRVMCLRIVFLALGAVPLALLQRELKFRSAFGARLAAAISSCVVIIPLAYRGLGVWSLVWGMLAGSAVQTLCLWWVSGWRPLFRWNTALLPTLLGFSKWVLLEGLLAAAINWGDSVMVGRFLGTEGLGKYRMAANALSFVSGILFAPLTPVALSLFSRLQGKSGEFQEAYLRLTRTASAMALPLGTGLALTAPALVALLLGPRWAGTEVALSLLGLKLAVDWLVGFNSVSFTAMGRPDINVKLLSIVCLFSLPAFAVSARFGLLAFCLTRLVAAIADNSLNLAVGLKVFQVPVRRFGRILWPALPAVLLMAVFLAISNWLLGRPTFLVVCGQAVAAAGLYVGVLFSLDPALVRGWFSNLRGAAR